MGSNIHNDQLDTQELCERSSALEFFSRKDVEENLFSRMSAALRYISSQQATHQAVKRDTFSNRTPHEGKVSNWNRLTKGRRSTDEILAQSTAVSQTDAYLGLHDSLQSTLYF